MYVVEIEEKLKLVYLLLCIYYLFVIVYWF